MTDDDYMELRSRLMAHQALLCAIVAAHPDKGSLAKFVLEVLDQMKSQFLASRLDDNALEIFDSEVQSILKKAGIDTQAA
jgi:hypothetical protein